MVVLLQDFVAPPSPLLVTMSQFPWLTHTMPRVLPQRFARLQTWFCQVLLMLRLVWNFSSNLLFSSSELITLSWIPDVLKLASVLMGSLLSVYASERALTKLWKSSFLIASLRDECETASPAFRWLWDSLEIAFGGDIKWQELLLAPSQGWQPPALLRTQPVLGCVLPPGSSLATLGQYATDSFSNQEPDVFQVCQLAWHDTIHGYMSTALKDWKNSVTVFQFFSYFLILFCDIFIFLVFLNLQNVKNWFFTTAFTANEIIQGINYASKSII